MSGMNLYEATRADLEAAARQEAVLKAENKRLLAALRGCVDLLGRVEKMTPWYSGWSIQRPRIAEAKAALNGGVLKTVEAK